MDIRQSYEKINISEQAKNQIKNDILAGEKTVRKENGSGAYIKIWENCGGCRIGVGSYCAFGGNGSRKVVPIFYDIHSEGQIFGYC